MLSPDLTVEGLLLATSRGDDDYAGEGGAAGVLAGRFQPPGLDGAGGSSYIDSVILRQKDSNSGWTSAADGTMEQRRYYCQNWRNDVSVILTSAAVMVEWAKFSAYGIPIGLPAGDIDSDFITDTGDVDAIEIWASSYDVRADLDLDGDIDGDDATLASGYEGWDLGWNVLSHADVANRAGYAGYQKDANLDISHVRNRVLEPHLGRWTRRDPLGYIDGMSLYEYAGSLALTHVDPDGFLYKKVILPYLVKEGASVGLCFKAAPALTCCTVLVAGTITAVCSYEVGRQIDKHLIDQCDEKAARCYLNCEAYVMSCMGAFYPDCDGQAYNRCVRAHRLDCQASCDESWVNCKSSFFATWRWEPPGCVACPWCFEFDCSDPRAQVCTPTCPCAL